MRRLLALTLVLTGGMAMADPWMDGLQRFHEQRARSIGGEDGWITLVALDWIEPGDNALGSSGALKLPAERAPAVVGTLTRSGDRIRARIAPGVKVTANGAPFTDGELVDDRDGKETVLVLGTLSMRVIKRGDRFALRVKDKDAPARRAFTGLTYFEPDARFRVRAKLVPSGKTIKVTNVLGTSEPMASPGTLHFSLDGKAYTLDAVQEPGESELFVIFRDASAGKGTYPSGRFLYAPQPDAHGEVDLDFNRAFSPPCAFTAYATCPLPPPQNVLPVAVLAGEKYSGHH